MVELEKPTWTFWMNKNLLHSTCNDYKKFQCLHFIDILFCSTAFLIIFFLLVVVHLYLVAERFFMFNLDFGWPVASSCDWYFVDHLIFLLYFIYFWVKCFLTCVYFVVSLLCHTQVSVWYVSWWCCRVGSKSYLSCNVPWWSQWWSC